MDNGGNWAPIASNSGIPTAALALAAERHGPLRETARWYPPAIEREVRDAIAFERRLAGSPVRRIGCVSLPVDHNISPYIARALAGDHLSDPAHHAATVSPVRSEVGAEESRSI